MIIWLYSLNQTSYIAAENLHNNYLELGVKTCHISDEKHIRNTNVDNVVKTAKLYKTGQESLTGYIIPIISTNFLPQTDTFNDLILVKNKSVDEINEIDGFADVANVMAQIADKKPHKGCRCNLHKMLVDAFDVIKQTLVLIEI